MKYPANNIQLNNYTMKISDFGLTHDEYTMLVDGLELLAKNNETPKGKFEVIAMSPDDEAPRIDELARRIRNGINQKINESAIKTEDIKILQGKLLMVKRAQGEAGVIDGVNGIINKED
jgi:hypothetical protein